MCAAGSANGRVRKVTREDIPRLAEINLFGWRMAYRGILSDQLMFVDRTVEKSMAKMRAQFEQNENLTWVYEDDDIVKGLLSFGPCRDKDKPAAVELYGLYVDPAFIGQGIGNAMLSYFERSEVAAKTDELVLWALEENYKAQKFYEAHGYRRDGGRKFLDGLQAWEIRYHKASGSEGKKS